MKLISDVIGELLGEEAVQVAFFIRKNAHASEFQVAKALKIDVHRARTILYKLHELDLASFERKKDRQRGWYITYWDFKEENIPKLFRKLQSEKLEKLQERLKKEESSVFYMCRNACTRMDFEKAVEFDFKCPECGELMNPMDNKRTIEFINEQMDEINKKLAEG